MTINTDTKIIHWKKPNQKLPYHNRKYHHRRGNIWTTDTRRTSQSHQNKSRETQHNPEDTLTSYNFKTPSQCGNIYGFLFVNVRPFLHTKSGKIDFVSVQTCNRRGRSEIIFGIKRGKYKYQDMGFTTTYFHGEDEFEHIQYFLSLAHLHTCTSKEHIRDIDQSVWKIKERVICGCHPMPYKKFTTLMRWSLVQYMVTWLKMFPFQKWDTKLLYPSTNHPRVPQYRLKQIKNHIKVICTGLHRYHNHNQEKNIRRDCTSSIKRMGQILFYVASQCKIALHIHMDRYTN